MRKAHKLAAALHKVGFEHLLSTYWGPKRLTVLAYHRINDAADPGFDHYQPNVSASPELFDRQMAYIARHFNVIDLAALHAYVRHGEPLPPRSLLITFDDGYLDNYQNAAPILMKHGLPAVIFLMTSRMDNPGQLPWWDAVAYLFAHTQKRQVDLPVIGLRDFTTEESQHAAREELIQVLKLIPEVEKQVALEQLQVALGVDLPTAPPVFMNWDQVRELAARGIACQPHTVNHPILTRIDPEQMRRELADSRDQIVEQTRQEIVAFAYPNGMPGDYDQNTLQALRDLGYRLAFTLSPGPVALKTVRERPLEIERIFLLYQDTLEAFIMKVMGADALLAHVRGS
jgi:peptidoglycan/xylan/chitin deacetylase (PgdA/CDA1 family)